MAHQVVWTENVLNDFIKLGNLNDFQAQLMRDRCNNVTITQMAIKYSRSESTIHREVARIKKIYDVTQKEHPDRLPIRKSSAKELYMDTH